MRPWLLSCVALVSTVACGPSEPKEDGGTKPPPTPFPLTTPHLRGYALEDAYPKADLTMPMAIAWPTAERPGMLVLERWGKIVEVDGADTRPVVDFQSEVQLQSEAGALGMAIHPRFGDGTGSSPYVYVWYNAVGDRQRLARFTWDPASRTFDDELVMIEIAEQALEHNAGKMSFGPDGFLYFGNGDDSNPNYHQRLDGSLFGGIFRIDVDQQGGSVSHPPPRQPENGTTQGYFIPNDNPFVGVPNALEEYYALGLRNPYGLSFDIETGDLWCAEVGETWREEVNRIVSGGNYQWPNREGEIVHDATPLTIGAERAPFSYYTHAEMGDLTSVLGGYVYRGKALPELDGRYLYSDWPSGHVWALDATGPTPVRTTLVHNLEWNKTMTMEQDPSGEVYLLDLHHLLRVVRAAEPGDVPKKLSETIIFQDVQRFDLDPSFVPYSINSPLWSDGAAKQRFIRVPPGERVSIGGDGAPVFPVGTILVKQFDHPAAVEPEGRGRRLETRVLVVAADTTYGLTYKWNAAGTDADLLLEAEDEAIVDTAGGETRNWHYPSFAQCWACHRSENRIIGFVPAQLSLAMKDGRNQLDALKERGVFEASAFSAPPTPLTPPRDTSASLQDRALSYLAANCAGCHHKDASYLGGEQTWQAEPGVPLDQRGLLGAQHHNWPMASGLGLPYAPLIDPGAPKNSILLARLKTTDPDLRMPPVARNTVDEEGVQIISEWILSLGAP